MMETELEKALEDTKRRYKYTLKELAKQINNELVSMEKTETFYEPKSMLDSLALQMIKDSNQLAALMAIKS